MECELLRSPMISYRSLLYNTTVLYDIWKSRVARPLFPVFGPHKEKRDKAIWQRETRYTELIISHRIRSL